jgi:hypothetical protein
VAKAKVRIVIAVARLMWGTVLLTPLGDALLRAELNRQRDGWRRERLERGELA